MMSKPLTFGELRIGEHFIDFPTDGDDSGHGGFRRGSFVLEKIQPIPTRVDYLFENAVRKKDNMKSVLPDTMLVYKIFLD